MPGENRALLSQTIWYLRFAREMQEWTCLGENINALRPRVTPQDQAQ